jgi:hypothetical protein
VKFPRALILSMMASAIIVLSSAVVPSDVPAAVPEVQVTSVPGNVTVVIQTDESQPLASDPFEQRSPPADLGSPPPAQY